MNARHLKKKLARTEKDLRQGKADWVKKLHNIPRMLEAVQAARASINRKQRRHKYSAQ